MKIVRRYEPDPARQRAALVAILSASRLSPPMSIHHSSDDGSENVVPFVCLRGDGTVAIVWTDGEVPLGDDAGPFDDAHPILLDDHVFASEDDEALYVELWSLEVACPACGRPLPYAGHPCLCEWVCELAA